MKPLKFLFWGLAVALAGLLTYRTLFGSDAHDKKILDPGRKSVQSLLARAEEKVPKEVSMPLDSLMVEVLEADYRKLKEKDLFSRYQTAQKPTPSKVKEQPPPKVKKEEPLVVFSYKGILQLGTKEVIILEPEGGKSFFVGKGDRMLLKDKELEYELIDITAEEVILLRKNPLPEERLSIPKSSQSK